MTGTKLLALAACAMIAVTSGLAQARSFKPEPRPGISTRAHHLERSFKRDRTISRDIRRYEHVHAEQGKR